MVEGVSIIALLMSIVSGLVLFFKSVKKCKVGSLEIEREREKDDTEQQHEFTLNLVKTLKNCTPRNNKSDDNSLEHNEKELLLEATISEIARRLEEEIEINKEFKRIENLNKEQHPKNSTFKGIMMSSMTSQRGIKVPPVKVQRINVPPIKVHERMPEKVHERMPEKVHENINVKIPVNIHTITENVPEKYIKNNTNIDGFINTLQSTDGYSSQHSSRGNSDSTSYSVSNVTSFISKKRKDDE
jgi:hypothetical protein